MAQNRSWETGNLEWQDNEHVSALADGERHLGHALEVGGDWHAYDATRLSETGDGFKWLGSFPQRERAKHAIELSLTGRRQLFLVPSVRPAAVRVAS